MSPKTLLVAEIGHNWIPYGWNSIKDHVQMVKDAGWDIAKFQAYDTDKIKKPGDQNYNELKDAELTFSQLKEASDICREVGVEFMASAFDVERVNWLEQLGVQRHKLASRSITDTKLIESMLATGKQVIASLANWANYDFYDLPKYKMDYLYCKSRRQILVNGFNVNELIYFLDRDCGFSDHTIGNADAMLALDSHAPILEKHITMNKNAAGWDQPSSADFNDMLEIGIYREHSNVYSR